MSNGPATLNPYDEVPYPSHPLPQTHPDRLATVAALFGLPAQPIDRCRVLELGCATGGNLIPMAHRHPGSRFVGLDYSRTQIEMGLRTVAELGLVNLELAHQSIEDVGPELGQFDYIICHGVYSWVTPELQDRLVAVCKAHLAPQGVAYISYNTLPGWHFRHTVRELSLLAGDERAPTAERIARARRLLELMNATLADQQAPATQLLRADVEFVLKQSDSYLFHEHLEQENHALYFHEFAERACAHDLQYLGETHASNMFPSNLGPQIERNLRAVARDVVSVEQHMDALRNCGFRQTLLCHSQVALSRQLNLDTLNRLYFSTRLKPVSESPDLASSAMEQFISTAGSSARSQSPPFKAALVHLGSIYPRSASVDEMLAGAVERLRKAGGRGELTPAERQGVAQNLAQCLASGMIEPYFEHDSFVTTISQRPEVSSLARAQARQTPHVTNRRHQLVPLDEVSQNLAPHLDGKVDRAGMYKILATAMEQGRLSMYRDGVPIGPDDPVDAILNKAVDVSLTQLASSCLLVA